MEHFVRSECGDAGLVRADVGSGGKARLRAVDRGKLFLQFIRQGAGMRELRPSAVPHTEDRGMR